MNPAKLKIPNIAVDVRAINLIIDAIPEAFCRFNSSSRSRRKNKNTYALPVHFTEIESLKLSVS